MRFNENESTFKRGPWIMHSIQLDATAEQTMRAIFGVAKARDSSKRVARACLASFLGCC